MDSLSTASASLQMWWVTLRLWPKQLTSELKGTEFCWHYFAINPFLNCIPAIFGNFAHENLDVWVDKGGWRNNAIFFFCMEWIPWILRLLCEKINCLCVEVESRIEVTVLWDGVGVFPSLLRFEDRGWRCPAGHLRHCLKLFTYNSWVTTLT